MAEGTQQGWAGRQVQHTEDADRTYRDSTVAVDAAIAVVTPPNAARALVVTGLVCGFLEGEQGDEEGVAALYEGDTVIWSWPLDKEQPFGMEFVHGIRCAAGVQARLSVVAAAGTCYANLKCRLE